MKKLILIVSFFLSIPILAQKQTVIRINGDQLTREYKVFFSAQDEKNVEITLYDQNEEALISQSVYGNGFVKLYDLSRIQPGKYTWEVKYDHKSYSESIEIYSEKELLKNSIEVDFSNFIVEINVKDYNNLPMNIFVYDENGDQLNYEYWKPNNQNRNKKIDISQFATKEIKLEIEQKGSLAYSESYAIY